MAQDQNNMGGMPFNMQQPQLNPNMQQNQFGMMGGMNPSPGGTPVPNMQPGAQNIPGVQPGMGGLQNIPQPQMGGLSVPPQGQQQAPKAATGTDVVATHKSKAPGEKMRKKIKITIRDRTVLYNSWMSFTKTGGLFIPSDETFEMGDEVMLILSVMENDRSFILMCKVVWIASNSGNANHPKGVGVLFPSDDNGKAAKNACETNLAGLLDNPRPTYTM